MKDKDVQSLDQRLKYNTYMPILIQGLRDTYLFNIIFIIQVLRIQNQALKMVVTVNGLDILNIMNLIFLDLIFQTNILYISQKVLIPIIGCII